MSHSGVNKLCWTITNWDVIQVTALLEYLDFTCQFYSEDKILRLGDSEAKKKFIMTCSNSMLNFSSDLGTGQCLYYINLIPHCYVNMK